MIYDVMFAVVTDLESMANKENSMLILDDQYVMAMDCYHLVVKHLNGVSNLVNKYFWMAPLDLKVYPTKFFFPLKKLHWESYVSIEDWGLSGLGMTLVQLYHYYLGPMYSLIFESRGVAQW